MEQKSRNASSLSNISAKIVLADSIPGHPSCQRCMCSACVRRYASQHVDIGTGLLNAHLVPPDTAVHHILITTVQSGCRRFAIGVKMLG
jgi:hypothetical protein